MIKKTILIIIGLFLIIISSYLVTAPIWYGTSTNQDNNLVGHWACEGNFDDSSSYGNDGTQSGGA